MRTPAYRSADMICCHICGHLAGILEVEAGRPIWVYCVTCGAVHRDRGPFYLLQARAYFPLPPEEDI